MAFDVGGPSKGKKKPKPDMNVTPLVDVVLVLLIIFMVITPLLAKQFWVHVPEAPHDTAPPTDAPDAIVVTVEADGSLRINRDVVDERELEPRLTRVLAASGQRTVVFDAADEAPYALAVAALDHCRGAGATTIAVATHELAD